MGEPTAAHEQGYEVRLQRIGAVVLRYGLVVTLAWIGAAKFAAYEAEAILSLVASSPLMAWLYTVFSVPTLSAVIGVVELSLAVLIAVAPLAPKVSAIGSIGAIGMFLITLSFLVTTDGVLQPGYGFPLPSSTGSFLVKDLLLLGAAIWTAGESLAAARARSNGPRSHHAPL